MDLIMGFKNTIASNKDYIIAVSALITSYFAYEGLTAWHQQMRGGSQFDNAKNILKAVYKVRDGFSHVRNPFIMAYEYPKEYLYESGMMVGNLKREYNYEGTLHVYEMRFNKLNDAFNELEEVILNAQVEWGRDYLEFIVPLRLCRSVLINNSRTYLDSIKPAVPSILSPFITNSFL